MADPTIIFELKLAARRKAGPGTTGIVRKGGVTLRYYPVCGRFVWFGQDGEISKTEALNLLIKHGKIDRK